MSNAKVTNWVEKFLVSLDKHEVLILDRVTFSAALLEAFPKLPKGLQEGAWGLVEEHKAEAEMELEDEDDDDGEDEAAPTPSPSPTPSVAELSATQPATQPAAPAKPKREHLPAHLRRAKVVRGLASHLDAIRAKCARHHSDIPWEAWNAAANALASIATKMEAYTPAQTRARRPSKAAVVATGDTVKISRRLGGYVDILGEAIARGNLTVIRANGAKVLVQPAPTDDPHATPCAPFLVEARDIENV